MKYKQLTLEQRYHLGASLRIGRKLSEIAKEIGVDKSTVSREIRRNGSGRGHYNPSRASALARERHQSKKKYRIDSQTWTRVYSLLERKWRPEQISMRLRLENFPTVSHETIYCHIYKNKLEGGLLYTHLPRQHKYRKRIHKYRKHGFRDPRRPISERPEIVETRSRIGDWEADTIIGRRQQQAIVSVVERRARFCVLKKVPARSADLVADAVCQKLLPVKDKVFTITSDNGSEFAGHKNIALSLGADFFFADPYSSWQRGTNENTNGLVRQFFPKKTDFSLLSDHDVQRVAHLLNHRPRKSLYFKTPFEILYNQNVALIT